MTLEETEKLELVQKYKDFKEEQDREEFWYGKLHGVYGIDPLSETLPYMEGYEQGREDLSQC